MKKLISIVVPCFNEQEVLPYFYEEIKKINDTKKWRDFAKKNNLFTTIGSDFHYADGIAPLIGLVSENLDLDDNYFEEVLKNLNN